MSAAATPPAPSTPWTRPWRSGGLPSALVIGFVAWISLVPVVFLLWGALFDAEGPTLAHFREAFAGVGLGAMVLNSLIFALGSSLLAVVLGTTLAFLVVRTDLPGRRLAFVLALVPLLLPGVLYTIAWILAASPRAGLLSQLLAPLAGPGAIDVFGMGGMIVVEGLHLAPLTLLIMAAAFRAMDGSLEEAAVVSGARPWTVLRRVTLPLVRPALLASLLLMGVRGLQAFEVPALLGIPDGTWVFTSRIWRALERFPAELGQAGAYSTTLLAMTVIGVWLYARATRRGERFGTLAGGRTTPPTIRLGRWRVPSAAAVGAYLAVTVLLPLGMLAWTSLQPYLSAPSVEGLSRLTLAAYRAELADGASLRALANSLALGLSAATVVVLLSAVAAWIVVRTRVRGRWLLDGLASLPIVVPGVVVGLALVFVYLRLPIAVYGTLWILLIAYVTQGLPYGMRFATTAMSQLGADVEEAARLSGAGWWQTFRRILLPMLAPTLAAGWLYVLVTSTRELSSSIVLYSPGSEVLAVRIFQHYQGGGFPQLAALGMIGTVLTAATLLLGWRAGVRIGTLDPTGRS